VVIVASDRPLDIAGLAARAAVRGERGYVLGEEDSRRFADGAAVLTDGWAPVDQLIG
jgi:hypothetical protein